MHPQSKRGGSVAPSLTAAPRHMPCATHRCVYGSPLAALREMRRVCKAGGRVILLEHSRSSNGAVAAYQDATAVGAARFGGKGCVYNQDVTRLAELSGLRVVRGREALGGLVALLECTPA